MVALKKEAAYLRQHIVIARFAVNLPPLECHENWIRELESKICVKVALHRDVGGGFHFLKLNSIEQVRQVLDLTPCHLKVGTALFQRWIPGFNPFQPSGLGIPCWINLKNLPLEFHRMEAKNLAATVGTVLDKDSNTPITADPRFCVAIDPVAGYVSKLSVATVTGQFVEVTVEYEVPDMSCRRCSGASHDESVYPSRGILLSPSYNFYHASSRPLRRDSSKYWPLHRRGKPNQQQSTRPQSRPPSTPTFDAEGFILVERRQQKS